MNDADLAFLPVDPERWFGLARTPRLATLLDLDGTLIDFAPTPDEATLDEATIACLRRLVAAGVDVAVVSGRTRASIDMQLRRVPDISWFAEHGAWQYDAGRWIALPRDGAAHDELATRLEPLVRVPGALIERKSLSVCVHWRMVDPRQRAALIEAVRFACAEWLASNPDYDLLPGVEVVEVRHVRAHKGVAVRRMRERIPGVRMIAIGDDITDEDMFAELGESDAGIAVGARPRRSLVRATVSGPRAVHGFLTWLASCRGSARVALRIMAS